MIRSSVLFSIVFFSSIAIILLKFVFRNNNAVLRLDVRFLLACMLFILFRLFVPVESPVTSNIPICKIYPDFYMGLKEPLAKVAGMEISIQNLFGVVWLIGAIIRISQFVHEYVSIRKELDLFDEMDNPRIFRIAEKIGKECRRKVRFKFLVTKREETPFTFGICKPDIVLPVPALELPDEDIYFILKHEMLHYYRGDTLIKLFCELLRAIYWWNPLVKTLGGLVSNMQEINVDFKIIRKLPELEQLKYSECLVKIAKDREERKRKRKRRNREAWMISFQGESSTAVRKRICLMMQNLEISGKKTVASILLSVIILGLVLVCPNVFVFEPYHIPEEDAAGSFGMQDGIFYLRNPDGTYEFYLDGEYIATVSEVAGDAQIYNSLEEAERAQ